MRTQHKSKQVWGIKPDQQTISVVRAVRRLYQSDKERPPSLLTMLLLYFRSFLSWSEVSILGLFPVHIDNTFSYSQPILPFVFIFPREPLRTTLLAAPQSALIYGCKQERNTHESLQNATDIGAPTPVQPVSKSIPTLYMSKTNLKKGQFTLQIKNIYIFPPTALAIYSSRLLWCWELLSFRDIDHCDVFLFWNIMELYLYSACGVQSTGTYDYLEKPSRDVWKETFLFSVSR